MNIERLGNIVKNLDNKRVPLNSVERDAKGREGLYPYIGANNILCYIDEFIFDEKILCVAEDGGSWGSSQVCANIYEGKTWVNNHSHVLVENGKAKLEYLRYYLNYANLNKYIVGTTRGKLTRTSLDKIEIPLPSLKQQIHIANILTKAESLIQQRKQSFALLDEFLKSTFLEMFGDPVRNEKGWEKDKVEKYADCIVPGRDKPKSFTGIIPWIRTEDLINKGFIEKSNENIGLTIDEIKEVKGKIIPKGSVIMTCVGQLNVISITEADCIINQQLHSFQCREKVNNIFLMFALGFQEKFMYNNASTTTVAYMNKSVCNSIPIIAPPINLQNEFADVVEKTEALKKQCQYSLQQLDQLFGSLSQRAFSGDLVDDNIIATPDKNETARNKEEQIESKKGIVTEAEKQNGIENIEIVKSVEVIQEVKSKKADSTITKSSTKQIKWESSSVRVIADLIYEQYWNFKDKKSYYFSPEMLYKFLLSVFGNSILYYTTKELIIKKNISEENTLRYFIDKALFDVDFPIKFQQVFYDASTENINLELLETDFQIIENRTKEKRSGIYFKIV